MTRLTKDAFFRLQKKQGYPDPAIRTLFRSRYGYFPEEVGGDVDLRGLEGTKKFMPRDPVTGDIMIGYGDIEGPAPPGAGRFLPPPATDEEKLRQRLISWQQRELRLHPSRVGTPVPMEHHLGGRRPGDVISFEEDIPMGAIREPGVQRSPRYMVKFRDAPFQWGGPHGTGGLPISPGDPSDAPTRERPRIQLPTSMARMALPKLTQYHPFTPRISLELDEQLDFPGMQRQSARVANWLQARRDPDILTIEDPAERREAAGRIARHHLPVFDIRNMAKGEMKGARSDVIGGMYQVQREIKRRVNSEARNLGLPPEKAVAVADSIVQSDVEHDDKRIAAMLWAAMRRAHSLATMGPPGSALRRPVPIEAILDMKVGDVERLAPIFVETPYETEMAPGHRLRMDDSRIPIPSSARDKKFGEWLQFLWANLSPLAWDRLRKAPQLGHVESPDEAFKKNPFTFHHIDFRQMYEDHAWSDFESTEVEAEDPGWADKWRDWFKYWKPWMYQQRDRRPNMEDVRKVRGKVAEAVYRKFYSYDYDFLPKVGAGIVSAGGSVAGALEQAAEMGLRAGESLAEEFHPGMGLGSALPRPSRNLTPSEKADLKQLFISRNIRKDAFNYLTRRQQKLISGMRVYDGTRLERVQGDIELMVSRQMRKDILVALDQELDTLVEMLPTMLAVTLGQDEFSADEIRYAGNVWDYFGMYYGRANEFWKDASASVVGGLLAFLKDPEGNLKAFPATSLLQLLPALKIMRSGARWARVPDAAKWALNRVIGFGTKVKEVMGVLTSKFPSVEGLKTLRAAKNVVSAKMITQYTKMLSKVDVIRNASRRAWANYKTKLIDKAAQAEALAAELLDHVFRGTTEKYFSRYRKTMLDWMNLIGEDLNWTAAFKSLKAPQQRYVISKIAKELVESGMKRGDPNFSRMMRTRLRYEFQTARTANAIGQEFLRHAGVGAGTRSYYTQMQEFSVFKDIVNKAAELASKDTSGRALRVYAEGVPGPSGVLETRAGAAVLHVDPKVVIALLEDLLEHKDAWHGTGARSTRVDVRGLAAESAQQPIATSVPIAVLKAKGYFGKAINPEVRRALGLPEGPTLLWEPAGGGMKGKVLFKNKNFQASIRQTIEELKQYEPLSNQSRAVMGLEDAPRNPDGTYVKRGKGLTVEDPLHPRGTWVHRHTNDALAEGMRRLPSEGAVTIDVARAASGHGKLLTEAGEAVPAGKIDLLTKAPLFRLAHQLGVEGISKRIKVGALRDVIKEHIAKQPALVVADVSPSTKPLLVKLKEASFQNYVRGGRDILEHIPESRAGIQQRWRELLAIAAESDKAFNKAASIGFQMEAQRLANAAQRQAIGSAMRNSAADAVDSLYKAIDDGIQLDSMPPVLILKGMPLASGKGVFEPRHLLRADRPTPYAGSLEMLLAERRQAAIAKVMADEKITPSVRELRVEQIKRSASDIGRRMRNYDNFGYNPKTMAYDTELRSYYGLPREGAIYVPKKFGQQLKLDYALRQELTNRGINQFITDLTQYSRRGQTLYNTGALTNNVGSNYIIQAMARGISPVGLTSKMKDSLRIWTQFKVEDGLMKAPRLYRPKWKITKEGDTHFVNGKPVDKAGLAAVKATIAQERAMYVALKTVGIDIGEAGKNLSNILSGEYLASEGRLTHYARELGKKISPSLGPAFGRAAEFASSPWKLMRRIYLFSDDIFRAEDAMHSYRLTTRDLRKLEPGRIYKLQMGHRHVAKITRHKDGKHYYVDGKLVNAEGLNLVKARASKFGANQKFVDYSDQPNFPARIRSNRLAAVLMPHFTWAFNATPRPGTWGIPGRLFGESVRRWTDSPAINGDIMARTSDKLARMVFFSGIHRQQFDANREYMRQVHSWDPRSPGNTNRFELSSNPMFVGSDAMRSMNAFDPGLRLAHAAWNIFGLASTDLKGAGRFVLANAEGGLRKYGYSADKYDDLPVKEQLRIDARFSRLKKALAASTGAVSWQDMSAAVAIAGSNVSQLVEALSSRDPHDPRQFDMNRLLSKTAFPLVLTHLTSKMLDTAASVVAPDSLLTAYRRNRNKPPDAQIIGIKDYISSWMGVMAPRRPIEADIRRAKNILQRSWRSALIPRNVLEDLRESKKYGGAASTDEQKARWAHAERWVEAVNQASKEAIEEFVDNYWRALRQLRYVRHGRKGVKDIKVPLDTGARERVLEERSERLDARARAQRGMSE